MALEIKSCPWNNIIESAFFHQGDREQLVLAMQSATCNLAQRHQAADASTCSSNPHFPCVYNAGSSFGSQYHGFNREEYTESMPCFYMYTESSSSS